MAKNKEKKKNTTLQKYRKWKGLDLGLTGGKFACPAIPFGIILGLNWSDWVGESPSEGWSIGIGFGMLIIATIAAYVAIWKKDKIIESKMSGLFYAALVLCIIGLSFKLLASIMNEMGNMFLYVSAGLAGSFAVDEVDVLAIRPKAQFYKKLVEDNGLSKSSAKRMDDEEQAKKEGEIARQERINLI